MIAEALRTDPKTITHVFRNMYWLEFVPDVETISALVESQDNKRWIECEIKLEKYVRAL